MSRPGVLGRCVLGPRFQVSHVPLVGLFCPGFLTCLCLCPVPSRHGMISLFLVFFPPSFDVLRQWDKRFTDIGMPTYQQLGTRLDTVSKGSAEPCVATAPERGVECTMSVQLVGRQHCAGPWFWEVPVPAVPWWLRVRSSGALLHARGNPRRGG